MSFSIKILIICCDSIWRLWCQISKLVKAVDKKKCNVAKTIQLCGGCGTVVTQHVFCASCMFDMWKQRLWRQEGFTSVCVYKAVFVSAVIEVMCSVTVRLRPYMKPSLTFGNGKNMSVLSVPFFLLCISLTFCLIRLFVSHSRSFISSFLYCVLIRSKGTL
jgi:hypothetical protein